MMRRRPARHDPGGAGDLSRLSAQGSDGERHKKDVGPSPQLNSLSSGGGQKAVDIHCHCLPGIDDGPADLGQAMALCRALVANGVGRVIATPHQLGRYNRINSATRVREATEALREALDAEGLSLSVRPGAEVRLDERIPSLLDDDELLTLGDSGRYLLLEQPREVLIDLLQLIGAMAERNVRIVLSHPEQHRGVAEAPQRVTEWVEAGALAQITAGSLLGRFGKRAERTAWRLLEMGVVAFVAGDAHDAQARPPEMAEAIEQIRRSLGDGMAWQLCVENPARVWEGLEVEQSFVAEVLRS